MMDTWNTEERAGLGNTGGYIQKLISVPLKANYEKPNLDLFYFCPRNNTNTFDKTLLFCTGGPGRVIKPHDTIWFRDLSVNGYKIVYFHLRGSGFSQLPESTDHDQYIRTAYAVDDLEEIRKYFVKKTPGRPWDAVVGYSYGAVLAQQYAKRHPKFVNKLILIGPISLDKFVGTNAAEAATTYAEYQESVNTIRGRIIDAIYELPIFSDEQSKLHIAPHRKEQITESLFGPHGIFQRIDQHFGSEQSIIDFLSAAQSNPDSLFEAKELLQAKELNYHIRFFQALRDLHRYGSRTDNDGAVNQEAKLSEIGEVIAKELRMVETKFSCHRQNVVELTNAPRSQRVFETMGVYDGLNRRFIKEWISDESKNVAQCIKRAAGDAWGDNYPGKKVAMIAETQERLIEPWSPARHNHDKPTLILKGGADPVTADQQAESYLSYVGKQSILLNFDGVGHEFILPGVSVSQPGIHPILHGGNANTLNCLVYAFIEHGFDNFKRAAEPICTALKVKEELPVDTRRPITPS
jgi:pimeloyl-ACP methyl ester carboxylesterase